MICLVVCLVASIAHAGEAPVYLPHSAREIRRGEREHGLKLAFIDVKRAYFYARARRPVYIEIPIEDYEPGDELRVGKLNLSLYGTRDAA